MAKRNIIRVPDDQPQIKSPPVTSDEAREQQLVSLALDLVEKRLREGTASSQETTHFLKLCSSTAKLEKKILEQQELLYAAKTSAIKSQANMEGVAAEAIKAMREYTGQSQGEEE
jgi:hypothetical protein